MAEHVMRWRGAHSKVLQDGDTYETCIEGAIRAGKTTVCLWREFNAAMAHPGIHSMIARWTDDGLFGLVAPLWRRICSDANVKLDWHPDEKYDQLPNGSRVYLRGLKSQDQTLRYSKFRGLTLARVYIDQAEEIPEDIYLEVTGRLSQQHYPYQMTISPQSVEQGHWIARRFPDDNRYLPKRKHVPLSVHDNAHNLTPDYIANLLSVYPPGHPKHKTLILGQRGMNVTGEPVYKGAFVRTLHERPLTFNSQLPLDVGFDFGKHHPCVVFRQTTPLGAVHYLGGILGQQMYLEDFLPVVLRYKSEWFPNPVEERWAIDPAGATDNSQGTRVNGTTILERHGIHAVYVMNSNAPDVRHEMIERHAALMRKRTAQGEAFAINNDQFLRVSEGNIVTDRFLADGFEAGYVWDEHFVSVGSKQMRKAKKDGWYEHGQNASEYLELNFGARPWKKAKKPVVVRPRVGQSSDAWLA